MGNCETDRKCDEVKTARERQSKSAGRCKRILMGACLAATMVAAVPTFAQNPDLPFTVSNPKHKKWPVEEAQRIYFAACERVARAIRPEKPPRLLPAFVLVLGSEKNEALRVGETSEIHLKEWNPTAFSQAVVVMAARAIFDNSQIASLSREALMSAQASVSVTELHEGK